MRFLASILFIVITFNGTSQIVPGSIIHWNNESLYNPATSGLLYKHNANLTFRSQYNPQNPDRNGSANYNTRIKGNHGIGAAYLFNQNSFDNFNSVRINYNYQLQFNENREHLLSFGGGISFNHRKYNFTFIAPTSLTDPALPSKEQYGFGLNFGVRYQLKKLGLGLSTSGLLITNTDRSEVEYNQQAPIYFLADYNFSIGESFEIKPSFVFKTFLNNHTFQLNTLFTLKKKYWLGINFRSKDTVGAMIGWNIQEKFRIGYAYEVYLSPLTTNIPGYHEVTIGLRIK